MHMRFTLFLVAATRMLAADAPQTKLENGKLKAVFHLPGKDGYYRGSRFDWSGVIKSLSFNGHEYFGVWFDKYDPELHDAITGPVEEFLSGDEALGYAAAKPGETFVRIGIGALRRPDSKPFERFGRYELVNRGTRSIAEKRDRIIFRHELNDAASGYAYKYEKTVRMVPGEATMIIEHRLKNMGKKTIATESYNHNFFMIDGEPTGPNMQVKFAFAAKPDRDMSAMAGSISDSQLSYSRELPKGESVFTEVKGFGGEAKDYDLRIENRKTRAGVRIRGDQPLSKVVFWSIKTVLCPEPYVRMDIAPGKTYSWSIRYDFYTF